jgi:hypothetical protein
LRAARHNFVPAIVNNLPLVGTESVLIVGAGFGWGAEELLAAMPGLDIVCIDTGSWIQAEKDNTEETYITAALAAQNITALDGRFAVAMTHTNLGKRAQFEEGNPNAGVHNIDLSTGQGRSEARKLLKTHNSFDWAISEDVLAWLTDAECTQMDTAGHQVATNVCHYTTLYDPRFDGELEPDPIWNWKYLNPADDQGWNKLNPIPAWYTETNWATLLPNSWIIGHRQGFSGVVNPGV